MSYPHILNEFVCYVEGVGQGMKVRSATLPKQEAITETDSYSAHATEVERVLGMKAMETKIVFAEGYDLLKLFGVFDGPKTFRLVGVRADGQGSEIADKVFIRGQSKLIEEKTWQSGKKDSGETEISIITESYKRVVDGETVFNRDDKAGVLFDGVKDRRENRRKILGI